MTERSYPVTVEFAPAYELLMSLDAYMVAPSHRTIDLGAEWVEQTRQRLTPAFAADLDAATDPLDYRLLGMLIQQCPGALWPATSTQEVAAPDASTFLNWLAGLSAGDLYERLSPAAGSLDLGALRDRSVSLLSRWNEEYFQHLEPSLLAGLAADADRLKHRIDQMAPELLVEEATRGYYLAPSPSVKAVRLVPQYHKRPITLQAQAGGTYLFFYPAADFPGRPGEPPFDLLRLTRTLADESRLRIIHLLAGGSHSFAEVGAHTGLTKGTVHRHLWALRFAGLVRCDLGDGRFSLRPGAFERVAEALTQFASQR